MTERDRLAARLLATFVSELEEQVSTLNAELLALEAAPRDPERLKSVFRIAHTLKGAARAAGVAPIERACHGLESLLAEARDGRRVLDKGDISLLFQTADALAAAGPAVRRGDDLSDSAITALGERRAGSGGAATEQGGIAPPHAPAATVAKEPEPGGHMRVDTAKLDALTAAGGQLLVAAGGVTDRSREVDALHEFALRWSAEWRRTGRELRLACERANIGATAGPVLHALGENLRQLVHDTSGSSAHLAANARQLSQAADEVSRAVHRLRLRPFADACDALPRTVRDLAVTAGKEVRLAVVGGEVEADRAVVDGLREALLHLVRNAVDHGIEPPGVRERSGKTRTGAVTVSASLRGDRLAVGVEDDGSGLDVAAIRRAIERRELPVPADEEGIARMLFTGGLSTRVEATTISGRGVGLDLVRAAVERLRGTIRVRWEASRGTTFTIECPPTLVSVRVVLVGVGTHRFAIPAGQIARMLRVEPGSVRQVEGRPVLPTGEGPVPLVSLARLLGPPLAEKPAPGPLPVVLLATGERRAGVVVDELLSEQEIVLRPVGREDGPGPRFVSGATLLGTGRVAPVLDVPAVLQAALEAGGGAAPGIAPAAAGPLRKRRVLVVDDSITTRTLEQSVLEAAGYEVRTSVDGSDAWKALQEHGCDLVVADIEMPRMDGFALCEAIRASKRFPELPIVLVTALETPEHRARGLEVGADAYIGKSSFDQQALLETIRQLLGEAEAA